LDEHVTPRVAAQMRAHRPDCFVVSVRDWQRGAFRQARDEEILAAAAAPHLTLVTYDQRTFAPLLMTWYQLGRSHAGVIFVDQRTIVPNDIGGLVRALIQVLDRQGGMDWDDRVTYLRP
jgi:predicted nuclease of predicted toxin-antitoxin system